MKYLGQFLLAMTVLVCLFYFPKVTMVFMLPIIPYLILTIAFKGSK